MPSFKEVRQVRLDELTPSPQQVRTRDVKKDLGELVDNIRVHGQLEPILITSRKNEAGKYDIVAGQRRWLAMKELGEETISASLLPDDIDDPTAHAMSISENLIRRDLNPKDIIDACTRLYRKYGSVKAVAEEFGLPYSRVRNYVKFDRLRPHLKDLVEHGELDIKTAIRIEDHVCGRDVPAAELSALAEELTGMTNAQQVDYLRHTRAGVEGVTSLASKERGDARHRPGAVAQIVVTLRSEHAETLRQWAREKNVTQDKGAAMIISAYFRRRDLESAV